VIRDEFPDIAILVLSAHVEVEHAMELLASGRSIGYLLKSRVTDVADFLDTLERIAKAGTTTRWRCSVRVSRRCWRSWPRDGPTPASAVGCGSPRAPSKSTSAAS
jgi:DNA-binding NarL/FixJ family response regulator